MRSYSETVRQSLVQQDSDEIIERIKCGALAEEAHETALAVLKERGVNTAGLPEKPIDEPTPLPNRNSWSPQERLNVRYRLYCAVSILLPLWALLVGIAAMDFVRGTRFPGIVQGLLLLAALVIPPALLSMRAWRAASRSPSISSFVGRHWLGYWSLSILSTWLALAFTAYGVFKEALR